MVAQPPRWDKKAQRGRVPHQNPSGFFNSPCPYLFSGQEGLGLGLDRHARMTSSNSTTGWLNVRSRKGVFCGAKPQLAAV